MEADAEVIDRIVSLAREREEVKFHTNTLVPNVLFVQHGSRDLERIPAPAPLRSHTFASLDCFIGALDEMGGLPGTDAMPEVFVNADGIFAFLDGSERRSLIRMPLRESTRLKKVEAMQKAAHSFQPKALVALLRTEFAGGVEVSVVDAFRNLKFTKTQTGEHFIEFGNEKMGKAVEASVRATAPIPQSFRIGGRLWMNPDLSFGFEVECSVDIDTDQGQIGLTVLPDECERVRGIAIRSLCGLIRDKTDGKIPVYHGSPT